MKFLLFAVSMFELHGGKTIKSYQTTQGKATEKNTQKSRETLKNVKQ